MWMWKGCGREGRHRRLRMGTENLEVKVMCSHAHAKFLTSPKFSSLLARGIGSRQTEGRVLPVLPLPPYTAINNKGRFCF